MQKLADETLVNAHETVINRWKNEKPEQYSRLDPQVRTEPIYRPLALSKTERNFYRERKEELQTLPRYRLQEVFAVITRHYRADYRIASIVDTRRMREYRERVSTILGGEVDWPRDVVDFARDTIPTRLHGPHFGMARVGSVSTDESVAPSIDELLPISVVKNFVRASSIEECEIYGALAEIQEDVSDNWREIVSEYSVQEYGADHVVIIVDDSVIESSLRNSREKIRQGVARIHRKTFSEEVDKIPLHLACSPRDIRMISELEAREKVDDESEFS